MHRVACSLLGEMMNEESRPQDGVPVVRRSAVWAAQRRRAPRRPRHTGHSPNTVVGRVSCCSRRRYAGTRLAAHRCPLLPAHLRGRLSVASEAAMWRRLLWDFRPFFFSLLFFSLLHRSRHRLPGSRPRPRPNPGTHRRLPTPSPSPCLVLALHAIPRPVSQFSRKYGLAVVGA